MSKIDIKKERKDFYAPSAKSAAVVDIPEFRFLMVDGRGDPNSSPQYQDAVGALFGVSYAAKFLIKKGPEKLDYAVMPLEGLWWADDMGAFTAGEKSKWRWTLMIRQPEFVGEDVIREAIEIAATKKGIAAARGLRIECFAEGRCAQILHVGPFSEEGPTVERLHDFISGRGKLRGKHHEIYLSDVRKAAPSRWRTIIRQPFA